MVSQFLLIAVKYLSHCVNNVLYAPVFLLIDTSWGTSLLQCGVTGNSASSHESSCRCTVEAAALVLRGVCPRVVWQGHRGHIRSPLVDAAKVVAPAWIPSPSV